MPELSKLDPASIYPGLRSFDILKQQKHLAESEVLGRMLVFFHPLTALWADACLFFDRDWNAKACQELSTVPICCAPL
jgi:hypothetical protein